MQGLIGRKIGTTRLFNKESGEAIPTTIVQTGTNIIQQIKTIKNDGYSAVQLGFDVCTEKRVSKPLLGHFKKHSSEPTRVTKEFALDPEDEKLECGQKVGAEVFEGVRFVDVIGISKGRGFTGTVKRWGFCIGRMTHGNMNKRARGSLGAGTYPGRVFPGLKMAGQHGNQRVTVKGVKVLGLDKDAGLIYLKGGIPGKKKGIVYLRKNNHKK